MPSLEMEVESVQMQQGWENSEPITMSKNKKINISKRLPYSGKFKPNVISYAKEHGNRATERPFGPPPTECVIRQWRKQEEQFLKMPKKKKALRGKPEKWANLEQRLKTWIMEQH